MSNNSRELKAVVSEFIQNPFLKGLRISVVHTKFGTLFATVLDASGSIVSEDYVHSEDAITNEQILNELAKFGFLVEYDPGVHLSAEQVDYLETLSGLHFDTIRKLTVTQKSAYKPAITNIIVFRCIDHPDWIDNNFVPKQEDLDAALVAGTAVNISNISSAESYDWSWLDYVGNIQQIIEANVDDSDHSAELNDSEE